MPPIKYLIWTDANIYCGIAQVAGNDSASSSNGANSGPNYARGDNGCWRRTDHLSELHELMHTLGAVQLSAPNSSGGYHCTDEYDVMCCADSGTVTLTYPCPISHEWLLDCNHDDYFNTSPPSGSYLASHWDVANSVFLAGALSGGGGTPSPSPSPSPSPPPTPTTTTTTFTGSLSKQHPVKKFALTVGDGTASNALQFSSTGGGKGKGGGSTLIPPTLELRILSTDGTVVADTTGPSVVQLVASLTAGTYTWEVSGTSSVSFTLLVTSTSP
jgi:hypothetical protein